VISSYAYTILQYVNASVIIQHVKDHATTRGLQNAVGPQTRPNLAGKLNMYN
jgi:hypothetical protein